MYKHDDCGCKSKETKKEYARAYILLQKYENLYSCKEGFLKGTIFQDLYRPYHERDKDKYKDKDYEYNLEYKKIKYER